ncbi:MAG: S-methyl-5-thioribose-1-phosphate isomerase [Candidatus Neomarinimicrobiota bacterium]
MIRPIFWEDERLYIIDQTLLPIEYRVVEIHDHFEMADAIRRLAIRGAPAIGIASAYGLILGLRPLIYSSNKSFFFSLNQISELLLDTRPTAVNIRWALKRMKDHALSIRNQPLPELWRSLLHEARKIQDEDIANCHKIAKYGAELLPEDATVLTHCNAGGLATGGFGTALGIIIHGFQIGKILHVFVDETRPLLQGARLTAWELTEENVPFTLITDNMAASIMKTKKIDAIIVGADRIAANYDTANKIGTLSLAISAKYFKIPFYVAAPFSTFDDKIADGSSIVVEERNGDEVRNVFGHRVVPDSYPAISPAFDVTPHELITAVVTERGVFRPAKSK